LAEFVASFPRRGNAKRVNDAYTAALAAGAPPEVLISGAKRYRRNCIRRKAYDRPRERQTQIAMVIVFSERISAGDRVTQLAFPFIAGDPPERGPSRYRRRLQRVAAAAFELGKRRAAGKRPISKVPRSFGAAAVPNKDVKPLNTFLPRQAHLDREARNELAILAKRVARLSLSH
jgi:hypothetical protein